MGENITESESTSGTSSTNSSGNVDGSVTVASDTTSDTASKATTSDTGTGKATATATTTTTSLSETSDTVVSDYTRRVSSTSAIENTPRNSTKNTTTAFLRGDDENNFVQFEDGEDSQLNNSSAHNACIEFWTTRLSSHWLECYWWVILIAILVLLIIISLSIWRSLRKKEPVKSSKVTSSNTGSAVELMPVKKGEKK